MSTDIIQYRESLKDEEVHMLQKIESRDRRQYYTVYKYLMLFCFVIPFITSWYRAYNGAPNAFSYTRFFVTTFFLLGISTFATWASYYVYHRKLQLDIKERTKIIEISRITRKVYIPARNAYYFYTSSRRKMNIQVTEPIFQLLREGDEVCLEFTAHSLHYLGYF